MTFALGSSAHTVRLRPQTPAAICLLFSWTEPAISVSWTEMAIFIMWCWRCRITGRIDAKHKLQRKCWMSAWADLRGCVSAPARSACHVCWQRAWARLHWQPSWWRSARRTCPHMACGRARPLSLWCQTNRYPRAARTCRAQQCQLASEWEDDSFSGSCESLTTRQ